MESECIYIEGCAEWSEPIRCAFVFDTVSQSVAAFYQKSQQVLSMITLKGLDQTGQVNFGVLVIQISRIVTSNVEACSATWNLRTVSLPLPPPSPAL